jgi:DNA-binding IclR family transcriptional regulator
MPDLNLDRVINFLGKSGKTTTDISHQFRLSQGEAHRICRFLEKGKFVEVYEKKIEGLTSKSVKHFAEKIS